jgi:Bacterial extracellular solute-binding proteins, family 3
MLNRLFEAARADVDQQIGWAKREARRQTRHTVYVVLLALFALLAALGALIVGLTALYAWMAIQLGQFIAFAVLGGALLLVALILIALLVVSRRPAIAARPPLRVALPATLLDSLGQDRKPGLDSGGDEAVRLVADAIRGGSRLEGIWRARGCGFGGPDRGPETQEGQSALKLGKIRSAAVCAFLALLLVPIAQSGACAQTQDAPPAKELVVGTKEAPPFAMRQQDGEWRGISIDLWRRIAEQTGRHYKFSEAATAQALIDGVANGSFDVAIAALTVTAARERIVDFTEPFYATGLGVAVPLDEGRWKAVWRALSSFGFFQAVLALLGIAMVVGLLVWALERNSTEHFKGGAKGLGTGHLVVGRRDGAGRCVAKCAGDAGGKNRRGELDDRLHHRDRRFHRRHHLDADQAGVARRGAERQRFALGSRWGDRRLGLSRSPADFAPQLCQCRGRVESAAGRRD